MKIQIEKCACCNGTGKNQGFDKIQNKWVYSIESTICKYCNGSGIRKFVTSINGNDFLRKKVYIN